jgi:hypothetical protein
VFIGDEVSVWEAGKLWRGEVVIAAHSMPLLLALSCPLRNGHDSDHLCYVSVTTIFKREGTKQPWGFVTWWHWRRWTSLLSIWALAGP